MGVRPEMADYSGIQGQYGYGMPSVYGNASLNPWTDQDEARYVGAQASVRDAEFALENANNQPGVDQASRIFQATQTLTAANQSLAQLEAERNYRLGGGLAPSAPAMTGRLGKVQRAKIQALAALQAASQNRDRVHAQYKAGRASAIDVYAADAAFEEAKNNYRKAGRGQNAAEILFNAATEGMDVAWSSGQELLPFGLGRSRWLGVAAETANAFGDTSISAGSLSSIIEGSDDVRWGVQDYLSPQSNLTNDPDAALAAMYGYNPNALQSQSTANTTSGISPGGSTVNLDDLSRVLQGRPNVTFNVGDMNAAMSRWDLEQRRMAMSYSRR